jgi:hypothetical protein
MIKKFVQDCDNLKQSKTKKNHSRSLFSNQLDTYG